MKIGNSLASLGLVAFLLGGACIVGCDNKTPEQKASDNMSKAADNVKDAAHDAADSTRDAAHTAADNTRDATHKAADKVRDATN